MRFLTVLLFATAVAVASPQGNSQGRGRGSQPAPAQESKSAGSTAKVAVNVFSATDVRIIREWFSKPANLNGLPPGLAKRESLPPGLERQLQKNGTLPPGLQQKIQPLPPVLEVQLVKLPAEQKRVVIGGSVVLMNSKTGIIFDILVKVF